MNHNFSPFISEEMLAAWLDGNVTHEQEQYISQMCAADPDMREIVDVNEQIDEYYEELVDSPIELPEELYTDFELPVLPMYDNAHQREEIYDDDSLEPYDGTDISQAGHHHVANFTHESDIETDEYPDANNFTLEEYTDNTYTDADNTWHNEVQDTWPDDNSSYDESQDDSMEFIS